MLVSQCQAHVNAYETHISCLIVRHILESGLDLILWIDEHALPALDVWVVFFFAPARVEA